MVGSTLRTQLTDLQFGRGVETVPQRSVLKGGEGHLSTGQWGDVRVLRVAQGSVLLPFPRQRDTGVLRVGQSVRVPASSTVTHTLTSVYEHCNKNLTEFLTKISFYNNFSFSYEYLT